MSVILPLADENSTLEKVGGKGASLARLSAAGLPVPDGFHITTQAYREFVTENQLESVIQSALKGADLSQPNALESASLRIRETFKQAEMPPNIAHDIVAAYAALPGVNPPIAVRSSATAEDLPQASFAGQQETYLNLNSPEGLLMATKKCWSSLWTARAIAYRARQKIAPEGVALAVVVQLLVPAEAAGILFTADPISGARDKVLISAAWGLGEAVVSGLVTPDSLTVDKVSGAVVSREIAFKQVMTVRVNGGVEEQPVPESLQRVPVLDDDDAARLSHLGVQIEELYRVPMDIEWALVDGKFAILQARPITVLPEIKEPPAEAFTSQVDWLLPDPKGQYMRSSVVDILPDPLSPLFESLGLPAAIDGVASVGRLVTHSEPVFPSDYFTTINHYAYMDAHIPPRSWWWILTGLVPHIPRMLSTGHLFLREYARPQYVKTITIWEERPLNQMPIGELWEGISQILEAAMFYLGTLMFATMGASAGSEMLFTRIYTKMVQKEGDPSAPTFLMGYDSIPIQAEKSLYDLAMWCQSRELLAAYIQKTPSEEIESQLEGGQSPKEIPIEDWQSFLRKFQDHLHHFGHIIYNLDFSHPLPLDHPEPMIETCKLYLQGGGVNPHERQRTSEEKRERAVQAALGRVKGLRRWAFKKSLGWAQSMSEVRESALADIGLGYPLLRRMFSEMGQRLAQNGVIDQAEDIYWLEKEEIEKCLKALELGERLDYLADQVQKRKLDWEDAKGLTPPPLLPPKERIMGIKTDIYVAASESDQIGNTLKGVAASSGKITASACVIQGVQDFHQMEPGAVLVAVTTTPAWTPLFAMASGVVTDVGGPLSHGSIVAREYGIPAVMGTGVATKRIRSGQVITVDGDVGLVSIKNK